jgi:hypothetical protein
VGLLFGTEGFDAARSFCTGTVCRLSLSTSLKAQQDLHDQNTHKSWNKIKWLKLLQNKEIRVTTGLKVH